MPGGPPPGGPPGGTGAATTVSGMPGMAHQGMAQVKTALEMLQKALPSLPLGSPLHQKTLKFVADVSKELGQGEQGGPDVKQQVAQMARQGTNPMQEAALSKLMPPPPQAAPPAAA